MTFSKCGKNNWGKMFSTLSHKIILFTQKENSRKRI